MNQGKDYASQNFAEVSWNGDLAALDQCAGRNSYIRIMWGAHQNCRPLGPSVDPLSQILRTESLEAESATSSPNLNQ